VHPVCGFRNQHTTFLFSQHEEAPRMPERPPAYVARCGAEIDADGHRLGAERAVSSLEDFVSCNRLTGFPHERGAGRESHYTFRLSGTGTTQVSSRAKEYKARAAECVRLCQETNDLALKAMLLVMAQRWLELAKDGTAENAAR
jgi:hypothetical protein